MHEVFPTAAVIGFGFAVFVDGLRPHYWKQIYIFPII